jgi:superfamily II DNA or RNA helicase
VIVSLEQLAFDSFTYGSQGKGRDLFNRGNVYAFKSVIDSFGEFQVRGTYLYSVRIGYFPESDSAAFQCTCPHFADGFFCKHIWASILESDQLNIFPGLKGRNAIEVKRGGGADDERKIINTAAGDIRPQLTHGHGGQVNMALTKLEQKNKKNFVPNWRLSLKKAEKRVASQQVGIHPDSNRPQTNAKVAHFVINLSASIETSRLSVHFFLQEHLKNGALGVIKQAELSHKLIPLFLDETDRSILWNLLGKSETKTQYYSHYERGVASASIPLEHAEEILEQISKTGRFHFLKNSDYYSYSDRNERPELGPYSYSSQTWALKLLIERAGKSFILTGRLTDGSQSRQIAEIIGRVGKFIFFNDLMVPSTVESSLAWLDLFKKNEKVGIPEREIDAFLEYFYSGASNVALELPEEIKFKEITSIGPTVRMTISTVDESQLLEALIDFNYSGQFIASDSPSPILVQVEQRQIIHRDLIAEAAVMAQFKSINPFIDVNGGAFPETEMLPLIEGALGLGWEVIAHKKNVRRPKDFQLNISSGIDWFDLNANFNFDGYTEFLPRLISAIKSGQRFIQLGDGTYGMLPVEWLKKFGPIASMGRATDSGIRLNKLQALFLNASLDDNEKFKADRKFKALKTIIDDFKDCAPISPGESFNGRLRQYQKEGLSWLSTIAKHEIGGILADDMGLGKTIQVLALLLQAKEKTSKKATRYPTLIVAPKSLIFNWQKEAEKFTPSLKVLNFTGPKRHENSAAFEGHDVILTTYQTLRIDIEELQKKKFDFFILDEAHFIKNPEAQASMACRLITATKKISLSGTPVENSLTDLFSILAVVTPGLFNDEQAQRWSRTNDPEEVQILSRALRPFILRRTKEQVLKDLPSRTEQVLYCELSPNERRRYSELKAYYWSQLSGKLKEKGLARSKIEILEALLRLRQAACHQGLLDDKLKGSSSAKFELLFDQLDTIIEDGHKVLIFSQFTSLLGLLSQQLQDKGIRFEYLDGKTTDRAERVEKFQSDPAIKVFLLSLKAGGVGLNLTAADYVFVLDPWWNPQAEAQAIDRTHRIGQTKKVFAYKIIAKDTVEEKILEMQNAKKELAKVIVSHEKGVLKNLKMEDLQALFA